ncbi:hypothetical protein FOIG_06541 [Fusarium odoratissimum NRRL 54006]|uniref:Uncharacterized protein n=1 Tax=Fusarium odoratissimum (strain NRRL 54006) TaxID=1089451 RepID=X0K0W8_FUSO5|nr:uncharacterized protein FOIG_06541 [Fusarium odoratissimum NRRL 54006]EXM02271.1 hypothetical protein FOIG_06541 [Fusarium odoratissimum NRRL 54006]
MINPEVAVQLHFSGRRISAVTVSNPAKTLEDHPKSDRRCDDRYVIHAVHHDKASENPSVALQPGFLGSCYQGFNSTAKAWTASEWDGDSGAVSILQEANELKKKVSEELYQLNRAIV